MAFTFPHVGEAGINDGQTEWDKGDIEILVSALRGYGVVTAALGAYTELNVQALAAPGMAVRTTVPAAVTEPSRYQAISTSASIAIGAADATLERIDLVCASTLADAYVVVAGANAAVGEAVYPAIPNNRVVLASVYVGPGVTSIVQANITDKRCFIGVTSRLVLDGQFSNPTAGYVSGAELYSKLLAGVPIPYVNTGLAGTFSLLGGPVGEMFARGQSGLWVPFPGGASRYGLYGDAGGGETGTPSDVFDTTHGMFRRYTSGAVSGNEAGLQLGAAGSGVHVRNIISWHLYKFRLPTITSIRAFIGLTDQTLATIVSSDTPAGHFMGLQFSTDRGDSTWQYASNDNSGGQTTTNTAVTVTTSPFYLLVGTVSTAFTIVAVLDSTFAVVYQALRGSTNMPGTTTRLHPVIGCETRTAAARDIDAAFARGVNNI